MKESFEPEIVLLYCGRSLAQNNNLSEGTRQGSGFRARLVMMPCSSKIEPQHLLKLIEQGADGVVVVACPEEQCQFMIGSSRAERRVKYARTLLDEVGMSADRLALVRRQGLAAGDIMAIAEETASIISPLGQNPMKMG
jgi:coenzyme F420-reducing hydrogenase delta subunit